VSQQLEARIIKLDGQIQTLRENLALLKQMEEQRKVKSDFDATQAEGVLAEMDKTISELDTTIEVDLEDMLQDDTSSSTSSTSLSSEEADLLDGL
jgi:predicted  nucleic acid-binding Zn-ribbon protein